MFSTPACGDQMDVTSPPPMKPLDGAPKSSSANTLPAFLLGTDSNYAKKDPLFNNTPLKSRTNNANSNNSNSSDVENRPPLIFSRKYKHGGGNTRPFQNHRSQPQNQMRSGPPVGGLGERLDRDASGLGSDLLSKHVMASSPLPEKNGQVPRITTPEFTNLRMDQAALSISPIMGNANSAQMMPNQNPTTPLARQMFEKQLQKTNPGRPAIVPQADHSMNNTSFSPDDEIDCWVSVFGFSSRNIDLIMKRLATCGSVVSRQPSKRENANWMHLRFASANQARRARQRFNCQILEATNIAVAVVECLEPSYILEFIKGGNGLLHQSIASGLDHNTSLNTSNIGMRSLIEPTQPVVNSDSDPFNLPQREPDNMVRRTLGYLLPSIF